jgi:hypothetical protein
MKHPDLCRTGLGRIDGIEIGQAAKSAVSYRYSWGGLS